MYLFNWHCHA